jgi:hypothetical protein
LIPLLVVVYSPSFITEEQGRRGRRRRRRWPVGLVTEEEAADGAGDMGLVLDDCDAAFAPFHARIWSACSPPP